MKVTMHDDEFSGSMFNLWIYCHHELDLPLVEGLHDLTIFCVFYSVEVIFREMEF
jgi:hypothetical protein